MTVTEQAPASVRQPRLFNDVGLGARLILGGVLLVAGARKAADPTAAGRAVRAYQLLPYDVTGVMGNMVPLLEIAAGVLLIVGLFSRISAAFASLLMSAFITGIGSAWARGLTIECGCFGGGGTIAAAQTQYLQEIIRDIGLMACGAWLTLRPRTTFSLDQRLFG